MTREELEQLVRTVSEDGYHHPHLEVHCHMALRKLEELIEQNEGTHEPLDWKDLGIEGNLDHVGIHITKFIIRRDETEDHLLNAACRILMALQLREEELNRGK